MKNDGIWTKIALGAAAGLAGTLVIQGLQTANQKWAPKAQAPIRMHPGKFMIDKVKNVLPESAANSISPGVEKTLMNLLPVGYGSTGAALYTALRSDPHVVLDGAALGAAVWAAGYLGWLPAFGLMPPVKEHTPAQIASSVGQHVLYGIATVAAFKKLKSTLA